MSIQSFQRGYLDKLAQFATKSAAPDARRIVGTPVPPNTMSGAAAQPRAAIGAPAVSWPTNLVDRATGATNVPANTIQGGSSSNAGLPIVPEENLPAGEIPAPVEPLDGDASEWSGDPGPVYYTVQPGDVLGRISREFDTPVDQIQGWNGIQDPDRIRSGSRIRVR